MSLSQSGGSFLSALGCGTRLLGGAYIALALARCWSRRDAGCILIGFGIVGASRTRRGSGRIGNSSSMLATNLLEMLAVKLLSC